MSDKTTVFTWIRTDSCESIQKILLAFFENLESSEKNYVIAEINSYWYTRTIINHNFINFENAIDVCKKLNEAKNKFGGWDNEYTFSCAYTFDDDHQLVRSENTSPTIPYEEAKKKLGCKYDGQHYFDIDYVVHNGKYEYKITVYTHDTPRIGRHGQFEYIYNLAKYKDIIARFEDTDEYNYIEIERTTISDKNTCYQDVKDTEFFQCFED